MKKNSRQNSTTGGAQIGTVQSQTASTVAPVVSGMTYDWERCLRDKSNELQHIAHWFSKVGLKADELLSKRQLKEAMRNLGWLIAKFSIIIQNAMYHLTTKEGEIFQIPHNKLLVFADR